MEQGERERAGQRPLTEAERKWGVRAMRKIRIQVAHCLEMIARGERELTIRRVGHVRREAAMAEMSDAELMGAIQGYRDQLERLGRTYGVRVESSEG